MVALFFGAKKSTKIPIKGTGENSGLKSHHVIYVRQRPSMGAGQRYSIIVLWCKEVARYDESALVGGFGDEGAAD